MPDSCFEFFKIQSVKVLKRGARIQVQFVIRFQGEVETMGGRSGAGLKAALSATQKFVGTIQFHLISRKKLMEFQKSDKARIKDREMTGKGRTPDVID